MLANLLGMKELKLGDVINTSLNEAPDTMPSVMYSAQKLLFQTRIRQSGSVIICSDASNIFILLHNNIILKSHENSHV